jgi:Fe-Mn family superoxide dismutase
MAAHDGERILLAKFGLPADAFRTDRRQALGLGLAAVAAVGTAAPAMADDPMFTLPPLPYAYVRAPTAQPAAAPCTRSSLPLRRCLPGLLCLIGKPWVPGMSVYGPHWYSQDALEPHIDAATMKFHHDFHHQVKSPPLQKSVTGPSLQTLRR